MRFFTVPSSLKLSLLVYILCLSTQTLKAQVPLPDEPRGDDMFDDAVAMPDFMDDGPRMSMQIQEGQYRLLYADSLVNDIVYEYAAFIDDAFIVKLNGKYGIIGQHGNTVLKMKYDTLAKIQGNYLLAAWKGKYGILSMKGKEILPLKYHRYLGSNTTNFFVFENKKGKMLLVNNKAKVILSNFDRIEVYNTGAVAVKDGKQALITTHSVGKYEYDSLFVDPGVSGYGYSGRKKSASIPKPYSRKSQSLLHVIAQQNGKVGLLDPYNKLIVPVEYDAIEFVKYKNYFLLKQDKKQGIYLTGAKKLIPAIYDNVYMDGISFFQVRIGMQSGLINNRTGEEILPVEYDKIRYTAHSYIVTKNKKQGLLDRYGNWQIELKYDALSTIGYSLSNTFDRFYKAGLDGKFGVIDTSNKLIVPLQFDDIGTFENKFFRVSKNYQYGLYNLEGKEILKPSYASIFAPGPRSTKYYITVKDSLYGVVSEDGKVLVENQVDQMKSIPNSQGDLIKAGYYEKSDFQFLQFKNGECALVDLYNADFKLYAGYSRIVQHISGYRQDTNYFIVQKGTKYGLIDQFNTTIIDFVYDSLDGRFAFYSGDNPNFGSLVAQKNGKYGVIGLNNETFVPFKYDRILKIGPTNFKVKNGNHYELMNVEGEIVNAGPFGEISQFESPGIALSFYKGKMRKINTEGKFLSSPIAMEPHKGFTSVIDLKRALVEVMNSKDDKKLREFAEMIAPSDHIIYFFENVGGKYQTAYKRQGRQAIVDEYYKVLYHLRSVDWKKIDYKNKILNSEDYTEYKDGMVTVYNESWRNSDSRLLRKILIKPIKVNGFWISSYYTLN